MAEPEIIIASTTQTPEELAEAFPEGTEVEEVPERPQEPQRTAEQREADDLRRLPKGVQKRFDRLTARLKSAEEELAKSRTPKPAEPANAPAANESAQGRSPKDAAKPEASRAPSYEQRAAAAKTRFADWDATFKAVEGIQVPEAVLEEIRRLENGPEVGYFLAKSPQLLDHLVKEPQLAVQRVRHIAQDLYCASMPGTAQLRQRVNELRAQQADAKEIAAGWNKFPVSGPVAHALQQALSSEQNGALVAIHLGRHPELAAE